MPRKFMYRGHTLEELESLKLDITEGVTKSYLNILRAKISEQVQKDNLKLTRANLQRARVRKSIGVAGPVEVYRWETEIAKSKIAVIEAQAKVRQAREALNQLLARPQADSFQIEEIDRDDLMPFPLDKNIDIYDLWKQSF